ncbi:MAG TPA: STAS domain-containing protein [Spirochaetota bacterium]|nr:STAS domain-containing protein [Spirochaetota bacterium]
MMDKFRYISEVQIRQKGNVVTVSLPKYFYIGNITEIEESWEKLLGMSPAIIGFDCTQLEFIDSSAIGTLVKFFNSSVKNNIEMYVYGLRDELLKIFDTTKINRVMTVMTTEDFQNKFLV